MKTATLSKIAGGSAIRTDTVYGVYHKFPVPGESFVMHSNPIVTGAVGRMIATSTVQSVEHVSDTEIVFYTLNSTYKLTLDSDCNSMSE